MATKEKVIPGGIIQESAVTGNRHYATGGTDVQVVESPKGPKLVRSRESAIDIIHTGEGHHDPIRLPPGKYAVGIVEEFDHAAQLKREVID